MSVSNSIEQLLQPYKVPYDITDIAHINRERDSTIQSLKPQGAATAKVLKDETGQRIIAIHSLDSVLDINAVSKTMQMSLQPLVGAKLQEFIAKCGRNFSKVPALPVINDLPTVVDKSLLDRESVYLDLGIDNQYIRIEQSHFKQMISEATTAKISQPLSAIDTPMKLVDDREMIEKSVSCFTERRIKKRLEDTLEFPPLPLTASKIIQLRVDPHADIGDLVDIVELDASLSVQVVSWAASPYYSAPGAIKSIHDAIVRVLGFDMVLNLALGLSLGKTMKMPTKGPNSCLPYWLQSVYVATTAEAIVKCMPRDKRPSFGTAYLSGLLHNFGYLIISEVFHSHFSIICDHIDANPQASVQSVERHVIGVDRDQLAAWLMDAWAMPEPVITALRYQSCEDFSDDDWEYPAILQLAKRLLLTHGIPTGANPEPIPDTLFERLCLDRAEVNEAMEELLEANEELQVMAKQME